MNKQLIITIFVVICFCSLSSAVSKSLRGSSTDDINLLTNFATSYLTSSSSRNSKKIALQLAKILVSDYRRFTLVVKGFLVFFDFDHNGIVTYTDIQNRVLTVFNGFPEAIKNMVLTKISNLKPLIQRLDLNRNGGIDIKTEGRIIAFILRSLLMNKLQHVYLNNLDTTMLDLLTTDNIELVDAALNEKLSITTEQQVDVIKFLKASTVEMISAKTEFNKKKLGLLLVHNLVNIYFDDAVLFRKLFRIQFQFLDSNGDNVLYIHEIQAYDQYLCRKTGTTYHKSNKLQIRHAFNRYFNTHFKNSQGYVTWKQLKARINRIRRRHANFVRRALKNIH